MRGAVDSTSLTGIDTFGRFPLLLTQAPARQADQMRLLLSALFFVSGFCSLLYQVVWLRLAFAQFGIVTPVLSVVVS